MVTGVFEFNTVVGLMFVVLRAVVCHLAVCANCSWRACGQRRMCYDTGYQNTPCRITEQDMYVILCNGYFFITVIYII